jgi:hypothetical protein
MFSKKVIRVEWLLIAFAFFLFFLGFSGCKSVDKNNKDEKIENNTNNKTVNIPDDGHVRVILNEKKGSFLLLYLVDPENMRYEPLFNFNDPLASFLSVYVDGNIYRLGRSKHFTTKIGRYGGNPALIFESSFLRVTQVFTPVKTSSYQTPNGVMMTIIVRNTGAQRSTVGVRMLLDTNLGEGQNKVPFLTNLEIVTSEILLEGNSNERFWVSRGNKTALMGSIVSPVEGFGKGPDFVHIANWKRLNDSLWRLPYSPGRSFNNLPLFIGDSAVCYYFGPEMLDRDKVFTYTVFLTTEDLAWYNFSVPPPHMTASTVQKAAPIPSSAQARQEPVNQAPVTQASVPQPKPVDISVIETQAQLEAASNNESADTITLIKLQELLNQFINGQILLSEQDLKEIEQAIENHRN